MVPGSTSTGWPSTNTSIWLPAAVAVVRPERQGKVFVTSPSPAAGRERADPAPVAVSRRRRDSGPAHLPPAAGRHHLPRSAEVGAAAARAVRRAGRRNMVLCGVLRREEARGCGARNASRHVTNAPSKARGQGSPCGRLRRQPRPPDGTSRVAGGRRRARGCSPAPLPRGGADPVTGGCGTAGGDGPALPVRHSPYGDRLGPFRRSFGNLRERADRQFSERSSSDRSARLRPSAISAFPRSPLGHRQTRRSGKFRLCSCRFRRPTAATSADAAKRGEGGTRIGVTPAQ